MAIYTVAITGVAAGVEVYGGLPAAIEYVSTLLGPAPEAWLLRTANDQGKSLVNATRYLDQQAWRGVATELAEGDDTTLAWPRVDDEDADVLTLADETEIDGERVPPEITWATFELAVLIAATPALIDKADTSSNIKAANAGGGVGVEFFAPTSVAAGTATPMPERVMRYVAKFLAGDAALGGAYAGCFGSGSKGHSDFAACHELDRTDPF